VQVANTWNNRLVADAGRPPKERLSHVSQPYRFQPRAPLLPSGLIGPVKIRQVEPR
jgi:hypothetical protein